MFLQVFPSEEDYRADPKKEKEPGIKTDPDVERMRRYFRQWKLIKKLR